MLCSLPNQVGVLNVLPRQQARLPSHTHITPGTVHVKMMAVCCRHRACWHGPDRDGKMEVELLPGQQQQLPPHHKWQRQQSLTALQGPDVATDVQVADFVSSTDIRGWALLGCLLKPWQQQQQQQPGAEAVSPGPAAAAAVKKGSTRVMGSSSDPAERPGHGGGGSSSSQEDVLPARRRKRRVHQTDSGGSSGSDEGVGLGQTGQPAGAMRHPPAAAGSDSDLEDDFEPVASSRPGKRLRRAAAAAEEEADGLDDCVDSDSKAVEGSPEPNAALAGSSTGKGAQAAGDDGAPAGIPLPSSASASQKLLGLVVQRFRLNPAQAAVAAHVADWLPQLMQDVQQRQQQGKKIRGIVRPNATALTANRAPSAAAAAAAAAGAGGIASAGGSSSGSRAPVCLVHGPFGTGKSTLLVALIHLLTGLGEQQVSAFSTVTWHQQQCVCCARIVASGPCSGGSLASAHQLTAELALHRLADSDSYAAALGVLCRQRELRAAAKQSSSGRHHASW